MIDGRCLLQGRLRIDVDCTPETLPLRRFDVEHVRGVARRAASGSRRRRSMERQSPGAGVQVLLDSAAAGGRPTPFPCRLPG